ncbi:beta-1,3-glucan-binding protein-like [Trichoplusia ni]|uniref:Beta-1,3-glucan-binding protein-like n=1 Tax=Trichoplusia ni TaxID=7111 RepID=A0A7E5W0H9_TRINI|nr:beta-1,3-glucan-binding protein-like [Trichoplusia ni]
MTCDVRSTLFFLFVLIRICLAQNFEVPEPKIEILKPKGFKVTLKDDGYSFFGFRGNINEEFHEVNEGQMKADIVSKQGGYWVYKNRSKKLEVGDTIFYWIYVIKGGKGSMSPFLEYTVSASENEIGVGSPSVNSYTDPNQTTTTPESPLSKRFGKLCEVSKTVVQGENSVCEGSLIFNEDFDTTGLRSLSKWNAEIMFPTEPDFPFNAYIPDNTVSFEDGSLVIKPVLTETQYGEDFLYNTVNLGVRCTGKIDRSECRHEASGANVFPPVLTAKISTRHHFNFKFGRIEVRAKLPAGSWLVPEINLEPSDHTYGQDHYESGFMRVAFARGNPSLAKKLYGGPVLSDTEPFRSALLKEKISIENWNKDFHNYTLVWRPDGIDLMVDGEQYGTVSPELGFFEDARKHGVTHSSHWVTGTIMAPLDKMFHVTLGLRVGGINDFADDVTDKPWANRASKARLNFWRQKDSWYPSWYNSDLHVDYVRVYAL